MTSRSPFDDFRPEHRLPLSEQRVPRTDDDDLPPVTAVATPRPRLPATDRGAVPTPAATTGRATAPRRLAFVLHAHIPWVLGHGRWPHGEEWLAEAIVHCYLPLLALLRRRAEAVQSDVLTVSVTPVLAAQLVDPRCSDLVEEFLGHHLQAAAELADSHPLADYWRRTLRRAGEEWRRIDGDIVGALRRLADDTVVELSTAAFSHPYLPLLQETGFVRLQLRAARELHRRLFGSEPRGLWMPECAYRPGGRWRHPVTGAVEGDRAGNETFLAEQGIDWTVVDAHLLLDGVPVGASVHSAAGEPHDVFDILDEPDAGLDEETDARSRVRPTRIGRSSVTAMVREPRTASQVWSRHGGYPGDGRYLEFHKRHAATGLRLWRVTDTAADLDDKLPYWPQDARSAIADQADHFLELVGSTPGFDDGVAVCPFDAELFGHWWHEGPRWLEAVLERVDDHPRLETTTPAREIDEHPPTRRRALAAGSWGAGGDDRVWVNERTESIWRRLGDAERRVAELIGSGATGDRVEAALKQLLLAAASDWPFLITTGTAADYATVRFERHVERLERLLDLPDDADLPDWTDEDLAVADVDPSWWEERR